MEIIIRSLCTGRSDRRLEYLCLGFELFPDHPPQTLYQGTQGDHTFEL